MLDFIAKPKDWMSAFRIWCPRVLMDITWQNRIKGVVSLICNACSVRLHLECFPLYHTDWTELITLPLSPCWRNHVLPDYEHVILIWSYFLLYFLLWKSPILGSWKTHFPFILPISIFVFKLAIVPNWKHWVSGCSPWDTIKMFTNIQTTSFQMFLLKISLNLHYYIWPWPDMG